MKFIKEEVPVMINDWTDDDWHKRATSWYEEEDISDDGSVVSRYNPKSRWDWYQVGGRWSDMLKIKPEASSASLGERSWVLDGVDKKRGFVDSALKGDVDWGHKGMDNFITFALLALDGTWYDKGGKRWFGVSTAEDEDWETTFKRLLSKVRDDERITVVDCHI